MNSDTIRESINPRVRAGLEVGDGIASDKLIGGSAARARHGGGILFQSDDVCVVM